VGAAIPRAVEHQDVQDGLAACRSLAVGSLQGRVVVKPEIRGLEEDELDGQS